MSKAYALKNLNGDSTIIPMQQPLFFSLKEKHLEHLDINLVIFYLRVECWQSPLIHVLFGGNQGSIYFTFRSVGNLIDPWLSMLTN